MPARTSGQTLQARPQAGRCATTPARIPKDLQDIGHEPKPKGVTPKATEPPVGTATAAGAAFFDMLSVFAGSGTSLGRERPMKAAGFLEQAAASQVRARTHPLVQEVVLTPASNVAANKTASREPASSRRNIPKA